ncbi:MAG: glutamine amidotransferase family protein [Hyphomicrobiaceae bacterium]
MCGIVGLFLKDTSLEPDLGRLTAAMLHEMRGRGPDSAGFAVYGHFESGVSKICAVRRSPKCDWMEVADRLRDALDIDVDVKVVADHAILSTRGDGEAVREWVIDNVPEATVLSQGSSVEIYKGVGDPDEIAGRLRLASFGGTHAIGHTRMATESAVTIAGSHPFSTGSDTCLVHNGSLSNHNRLRESLKRYGERFQTENDTEVAAGYLSWRMRSGDTLRQALESSLRDLDGFYTFVVGTRDGFAVLRDPVACKPAVMAETDQWVGFGSEFRALAALPGIDHARIWEPAPATVYAWSRS